MTALAAHPAGWDLWRLLSGLAMEELGPSQAIDHLCEEAAEAGPRSLLLTRALRITDILAEAEQAAVQGCRAIAVEHSIALSAGDLGHITKAMAMSVAQIVGIGSRIGAIASRFYGEPSSALRVIGVRGGVEASSLAHLIAQALADERCGLVSSLGIGFPDQHWSENLWGERVWNQGVRGRGLAGEPLRQPSPVELQHALARLKAAGGSAVALEIPDTANGAPIDLDAWLETNGIILAIDVDAGGKQSGLTREDAWLQLSEISPRPEGLHLNLDGPTGPRALEVPLLGRANGEHLWTLLRFLRALGLDGDTSLSKLARLRSVPGRMEGFGGQRAPLVVVDAAKTPTALQRAIGDLRQHRQGRLTTVFGCQGHRDQQDRAEWGRVAEHHSDLIILTDHNPAGEDGDRIIAQVLSGTRDPDRILIERQRGLAIRRAMTLAGMGDTLLIAGKGQETTQDMGELKVRFSDRAQVVQALTEWRGSAR